MVAVGLTVNVVAVPKIVRGLPSTIHEKVSGEPPVPPELKVAEPPVQIEVTLAVALAATGTTVTVTGAEVVAQNVVGLVAVTV